LTLNPNSHAPILVTGAHRSGTTWVGKMLAASGQAAYISEPLNVLHRPGVFSAPIQHWYTYICVENESDYLPALRQTLAFRYHTWDEIQSLRSRKDALRMARDWSTFLAGKLGKKRPLLKDPFAVFSAPWYARRLGCRVVITVRHPAAFASSLKRLGWTFQFDDLLQQPLLMEHVLIPFLPEIEAISAEDCIGQAATLWKIIYHTVNEYRRQHPEFIIQRHEDLSQHPIQGFNDLYTALGLRFNDRARRAVIQSSSSANPGELSTRAIHAYRLNSRANLAHWKSRLTRDEIRRVARITGEIAAHFYADIDWE
jgi:hypothetical protein